jgi:hypothetical protein
MTFSWYKVCILFLADCVSIATPADWPVYTIVQHTVTFYSYIHFKKKVVGAVIRKLN